jgi:hypothetical protein
MTTSFYEIASDGMPPQRTATTVIVAKLQPLLYGAGKTKNWSLKVNGAGTTINGGNALNSRKF